MGSFLIYPSGSIGSKTGTWYANDDGSGFNDGTDVGLLSGINKIGAVGFPITACGRLDAVRDPSPVGTPQYIKFLFASASISLDGNPAIDINNLPTGFNMLSAAIKVINRGSGITAASTFEIQDGEGNYHSLAFVPDLSTFTYNYDFTIPPTYLAVMDTFGLRINLTGATDFISFADGRIEGTYKIISSNWRLTNLTHPNSTTPLTVYPGDRVRIDTPDDSYDFSTITQVDFSSLDDGTDFYVIFNIDFLVWTPIGIEFLIPVFPIPTVKKKILELDIQGTQFSGRAHFTEIQVVIANASGMYTIVTDKTSDTLYTDSSSGNTTIEAKIPDPFIKTGFIGA